MRGRGIIYSAEEMAWLEENRLLVIGEYHASFVAAFGREEVSRINLHSLRKRKGWLTGRTGRFDRGHAPANKGKPHPARGRSTETQFKKGKPPRNIKFLGHERLSKEGYVEISVAERNPHTGYERRYVQKHRWLWEKANGPVPAGHALKCIDGNRRNTDPSNWECVHRGVLLRLNGCPRGRTVAYDQAADELKPIILAAAKLKRVQRQRQREAHGG